MQSLGNQLNQVVAAARSALFLQGEIAQLTYGAFDVTAEKLDELEQDEIEIPIPVGYKPDRSTVTSNRKYTKAELLNRYRYLANHQLAINGIVQLVTIVEAMLNDVVRLIVLKYPQKLGSKRTVPMETVFEATSIEEVHLRATDMLLNEMSYKSPGEFAEFFGKCVGVNLLECPAFHRYIEVKASRDIFIHNQGVANDIYARKAGSHARVSPGLVLPADGAYFLESYEASLRVSEWLERELHDHWHSSDFEDRQRSQMEMKLQQPARDSNAVEPKSPG